MFELVLLVLCIICKNRASNMQLMHGFICMTTSPRPRMAAHNEPTQLNKISSAL